MAQPSSALPPPLPAALPRSASSRTAGRRGLALQPGGDDLSAGGHVIDVRALTGDASTAAPTRRRGDDDRVSIISADDGTSAPGSDGRPAMLHRSAPAPARNRKSLYVRCSEGIIVVVVLGVIVMSALMMWYLIEQGSEIHILAWAVAGIFVALSLPISLHDIHMHCIHYVSPMQKFYVRIIGLVPIYSLESWFALRFKEDRVYFETARDAYEAFVLYAFFQLMLSFLGGREKLAERLRARPKERSHSLMPFCGKGWKMGSRFVHRTTVGVYQYVFLRVVCSVLMLIFETQGRYMEGNWSPAYFYVWSTIIINCSQMYALACLALFYVELRADLKPLYPLGKFAIVKAVVFFSWWQGVGISALASFGVLHGDGQSYSDDDVSYGLQDFLICVEMFAAALAHHAYFNSTDFWSPVTGRATPLTLMQRAVTDFNGRGSSAGGGGGAGAGVRIQRGTSSSSAAPLSYSGRTGAAPSSAAAAGRGGADGSGATPSKGVAAAGGHAASVAPAAAAAATPQAWRPGSSAAATNPHYDYFRASPAAAVGADGPPHANAGTAAQRSSSAGSGGAGGAAAPPSPPLLHGAPPGGTATTADTDADAAAAVTPAGLRAVLLDVLPLDLVADTGDQLRSGFGLLHKYQKRKQQAVDDAAMIDDLMRRGNARSKARSKFSDEGGGGGGDAEAPAEVEEAGAGGEETATPRLQQSQSSQQRAADEDGDGGDSGAVDPFAAAGARAGPGTIGS